MRPVTHSPMRLRRRSAALDADPKAKEMRHFLTSHCHEERLRDAAGLDAGKPRPTPESVAWDVKVIREIDNRENGIEAGPLIGNCDARLRWRDEMDRRVRRLMQDADLTLQDNLQDLDKARLRCGHLDKTFAWYERHAKKEAQKERPAPPYLRFSVGQPVMAGSLRDGGVRPSEAAIEAVAAAKRLAASSSTTTSVFLAAATRTVGGDSHCDAARFATACDTAAARNLHARSVHGAGHAGGLRWSRSWAPCQQSGRLGFPSTCLP